MADQSVQEPDDDNSDDLQRVIAELGGDSEGTTVRLLRLDKAGARTGAIVADMDPSEFSFMEVKTRYGGGFYRAKLTAQNGRLIRNQAFALEGKPKVVDDTPQASIQPVNTSRETDPMIAMMNMQMTMMREQAKETQTFMREFLSAQRQAPVQVAAPAPAFGPQEMVSLIATLVPLFTQKTAADPMAPFIKGLELGKEMSGGSGGEDESALGVLSKGLDTFGPLIQGIVAAPASPQASGPGRRGARTLQSPAPQAQVQTKPPESKPPQMTAEQSEAYMLVKMLASASLSAAQSGDEPSSMVAQYGGMIPVKYREAVADPDIVNALVKVEPALEPHRSWLDRLRIAFRESYASPLERAEDLGIKVDYGPPAS